MIFRQDIFSTKLDKCNYRLYNYPIINNKEDNYMTNREDAFKTRMTQVDENQILIHSLNSRPPVTNPKDVLPTKENNEKGGK